MGVATWSRVEKLKVAGQAEIHLVRGESGELAIMKKLLKSPQLDDADAELRRFRREVRAQSALNHPGIMPIIGYNFKADPPFYIMPKAEKTLEDVIKDNPKGLPPDIAAEIILSVVDAVEYAHQQGIYHRDLKPANILLLDADWVVGDFGMCRDLSSDSTTITQPHSIMGTVAYMAPEQFDNGHVIGAPADVYALAKVFVHMLTGKSPFPYIPFDQVPSEYRYLVTKALVEDPAARHASVAEFGRQIELVAGKEALLSIEDRARKLLGAASKGDTSAAGELLNVLVSRADDEVLYTSFVAKLPEPVLESMQASNREAFEHLVRTFDEFSEGGHPFNYVDVIADFFAMVFRIAKSPMIRRLALRRIMVVGEAHNRFYVGEVFARIVASLKHPHEILMAADVMGADTDVAHWYNDYFLSKATLPNQIREILEDRM